MKEKFALAFQKLTQYPFQKRSSLADYRIKVEMDEQEYIVKVFDKETGELLDEDQFRFFDAATRTHREVMHEILHQIIKFMIE